MDQAGLKALVIGATGAIGRELITELIASPKWREINVIVRRQLPQWQLYDPVLQKKLKIIQIDNMDELQNIEKWKFEDINTFFCLLGTRTREGDAQFTKVDYHYPVYGAQIAKKNNIPHYSLLTSGKADKSSMFLYLRVKGQAEEAIKSHKFQRTSIFRPGLLLNRDNDDRWIEKFASYVPFLSKIQSRDLAKAIRIDAEKYHNTQGIQIYENNDIIDKNMSLRVDQIQRQLFAHQQSNLQVADPKATLQFYRSKSTFDREYLNRLFHTKNYEHREFLFKVVKENPQIFKHHHLEDFSRDEQRYHSFQAMKGFFKFIGISYEQYQKDPNQITATSSGMYSFDPAVCIKFGVHFHLYAKTVLNLGTEKHLKYFENAVAFTDIGSFALTEMGHGSNVKNILTTAVYDHQQKSFVINTPHELATKFWIGATANLANMTVVFAKLYHNNEDKGVHAFLVEIRDKSNHMVKPGITIGDCGPKNGLDGIDNGFLIFNNLVIPKDNLLDKFSQIDDEGNYHTQIEDQDKSFAIQLGSLSGGRVILSLYASLSSLSALTIAIRYAAIRKQFSLPGTEEQSIIEYPLTQLRLMVPLASTLVYLIASQNLNILWDSTQAAKFDPKSTAEVHAISSILKGHLSSFANRVILECRQILGGHGYHKYNRLGVMLHDQDINNTWEGDSNVLLQQTAKFLLDNFQKRPKIKYQSVKFFNNSHKVCFSNKQSFLDIQLLCRALEIRCFKLVEQSANSFHENLGQYNLFEAWNQTLPFNLIKAAYAYADVYCMQEWQKSVNDRKLDTVFCIWVLSLFDQDPSFRDLGIITANNMKDIQSTILTLCSELKEEAVGIVDSLGPPDEILGSIFGSYDGDIYKKYLARIYNNKNTFSRVDWWKEIQQK